MFSLNFLRQNKTIFNYCCSVKQSYLNQTFRYILNPTYRLSPKTSKTTLISQKILRIPNQTLKYAQTGLGTQNLVQPKKVVGYWLLGCSGMIIVAVILGGVTRLTESGLSMVTWQLLGEKVPMVQTEWLLEFQRYQQYPEYKLLKRDITLDEFKKIWWMEYAHRTWGRLIGAAFYLPAAFFWFKGFLPPSYKKRIAIFGVLIAMQGLMGWYMVKSGLEDRFHKETDVPRVSQYRLAVHLGLALLLYTGTLYSALSILLLQPKLATSFNMKKLRVMTHLSKGLIFLTAISGAFVSGLDAGLLYNSFPKMGENWIPDDILSLSPVFKNFTENPVTVQFDHRLLGITTLTVIFSLWCLSKRVSLPHRTEKAVNALACMGLVQVLLGITTLVHFVPTSIAVLHQSGSLALISFATWLTYELKLLKYLPK